MRTGIAVIVAAALLVTEHAWSQGQHGGHSEGPSAAAPMVEGEVRRVDRDAQKITIRHGPLAQFDMPAMTMVFQVKDPAALNQLKPGDKIRFVPQKVGGAFLADKIEPVR